MSALAASPKVVPKKSAFSCEPCRKRKVKCPGQKPECSRCLLRKDECTYKLNPTLLYTERLERRIRELEENLEAARQKTAQETDFHPCHLLLPPSPGGLTDDSSQSVVKGFRGLEVDNNGVITYHGATSFFQLPGDHCMTRPGTVALSPQPCNEDAGERRERLVTNAWQQRALENLSATPEPFQYLLNTHWCWIQPLFNFIYRPAFTRDMQLMGPYYSHTLMNAVLSHSVRWAKSDGATRELLDDAYEGGLVFGRHARSMVLEELSRGDCSVPTVQTFLLLSAQECSLGNSAQAYAYSGIAFRMIDHLGICVESRRYAGEVPLTDEDMEIRTRLFWSCYFWDKMISLYLGRSPSLQHSVVSPAQMMLDDSAEEELWVPFGLEDPVMYPPTPAHSASCFTRMCQLSVIFNQILIHMYDPLRQNTAIEMQECLMHQEVALQNWWRDLPAPLKLEAAALPDRAPPSHIVTLNCLFNTFKMLLYRPMLSRRSAPAADVGELGPKPSYLVQCVEAATSIISIFDLFCTTFGYGRCVLSLSYSVYIAASIFLLQVQANVSDKVAMWRLEYCIHALSRVQYVNAVIGTGLNLLTRELMVLGLETPLMTVPQMNLGEPSHDHTQPFDFVPLGLGRPQVNMYEMTAEQFAAVSSLEPLSANVGALCDGQS